MPQKEVRDIERDKASGVTIEPQGNSLQKLIGCLKGGLWRLWTSPVTLLAGRPGSRFDRRAAAARLQARVTRRLRAASSMSTSS